MFKDYKKYLSTSLKVYLFVLIIIFIMKLVGFNYFGIDLNNPTINAINDFCIRHKIDYIWCFIDLYLQLYIFTSLVCKRKDIHLFVLIGTIINMLVQLLLMHYSKMQVLYMPFSILLNLLLPMIINKRFFIKRQIMYMFVIISYQVISLFVRTPFMFQYGNFVMDFLLNIDQLIMMIITYKLIFMKGEKELWEQVVGSFSQKKIHLKTLPRKLHQSWLNFKKQPKQIRLEISIYFVLSLIWNTLSIVLILFVAKLNHTFIECIFILTSFWLSKKAFGKAFHLSSMMQCFVVSNLTYYVLNRITTPLGISIIIPILLGVGLSCVTSKLVKKIYKPLYRGMSEELFNETILKIVDKDSEKYKICYDYYVKKERALALSFKYKYSEAGIRKIKDRVNEKIKELE